VLARSIDELEEQARAGSEARALDLLHRLVPEYGRPGADDAVAKVTRLDRRRLGPAQ
jgi:hypothetical protein